MVSMLLLLTISDASLCGRCRIFVFAMVIPLAGMAYLSGSLLLFWNKARRRRTQEFEQSTPGVKEGGPLSIFAMLFGQAAPGKEQGPDRSD